jgi:DUF1009 family protein
VTFRVERLGSLVAHLVDLGVEAVCFSGGVRRPLLDPAQVDEATAPLLPSLQEALRLDDDGALRSVIALFEAAGFAVVAATDLVPELLPPAGVLSAARPSAEQVADARRAEAAQRVLAAEEIGRGVIVRRGQVIAVEAQPGTDVLLRSVIGWAEGALYFKAPSPGRDRRVELPVIGPATLERAVAARLGAVVVEAGGVMVLRRQDCAALADAAGLVLWVREPGA